MNPEKFMREWHERAYKQAQNDHTNPLSDAEIDELFEHFSAHLRVTVPDWKILPFKACNPDPVYATYCEWDVGKYYKDKGKIEFYIRPNIRLALDEFMHHIVTDKLRQLKEAIWEELNCNQKESLEKIINEIDPGVDPKDPIEQMKKMPEQELHRNILEANAFWSVEEGG